jgi:hypothetical protein
MRALASLKERAIPLRLSRIKDLKGAEIPLALIKLNLLGGKLLHDALALALPASIIL